MKILSLFKSRKEYLGVEVGTEQLKKILDANGKKFHFKWQSDTEFIMSLNFSVGSDLVFDTNYHNTRSDIIVKGKIIPLSETKTKIVLETKSKNFLIFFFLIPPLALVMDLLVNESLPFFLISIPVFGFAVVLTLHVIKSEENGLVHKFKQFLNNRINEMPQHEI